MGSACAPQPAPTGPYTRIVLVTLDTLRADHLGAYGYPRDTSPFFDELAAGGVLFERAYAATSVTSPSHASIFTSLYPIQHGVRRNGEKLHEKFVTLAELLRQRGFATAGFVSTDTHFEKTKLDRGFTAFDEPRLPPGQVYRSATGTVNAALRWLEDDAGEGPFFLFVHLFDAHLPRRAPAEHRAAVAPGSPEEKRDLVRYLVDVQRVDLGAFHKGSAGVVKVHTDYGAEIHYADAELRRLYDRMTELGLAAGTLWVVTADHGEGLGNHGYRHHGRHIYDEQVRVPLLFYAGQPPLASRRVSDVVEQVDIMPTLAAFAGIDASALASLGPLQGRSLLPLLEGRAGIDPRAAFVQRRSYTNSDRAFTLAAADFELGSKYGWIGPRWKYIHRTIGADELYDLAGDPYETRNLVQSHAGEAERLKAALLERVRTLRSGGEPTAEPVDRETLEKLKALGYVP